MFFTVVPLNSHSIYIVYFQNTAASWPVPRLAVLRGLTTKYNTQVAADTDSFPRRIRSMVQDIVDLRENKWVPRREKAKPQRISDIHR